MKYKYAKLFLALLFIAGSNRILAKEDPIVRSSVITFKEIEEYSKTHPESPKQFIGNKHEEDEADEAIPIFKVKDALKAQKDPYGTMIPSNNKYSSTTLDASPAPSVNFTAIDDNGMYIPPDVNGAVGPNHVMTTLNSQVRIQNLTGTIISTVTLASFWSTVFSGTVFDPKILYEPFNNRWIITTTAGPQSSTSSILVGVSQTNDPTGAWNLYSLDVDAGNTTWMDYPSLGFNKDWVVISGNMFTNSGNSFVNTVVYIFKKADLYAHVVSPAVTKLTVSGAFTLAPAATYDNSIATEYLIQRVNGSSGGSGFMGLYQITGAVGSETLSLVTQFSTPNPWSSGAAATNSAPQSGTANKIANNDDRVQNVVYRNGTLWAAHTVFLPAGAPTRSAVQWWQVTPTGAILQRGRVDAGAATNFYAFPSIAVNVNNDVLVGFSKFSSSIFASSAYANRLSSDPVNTLQSDFVFKSGLGTYFKTFSGTSNRWGDYSMTMTDPTGVDFWTVQEYAKAPVSGTSFWGTWWAKVSTTPCSPTNPVSVSIAASPTTTVCQGQSVTFTATPTNPGATPTYQWIKNGKNVGGNSTTYTDNAMVNGDQVYCYLTSSISCPTGNPGLSNVIMMTVNTIDDNNPCTNDACNSSTAVVTHTPLNVDDSNPCTTDACVSSVITTTLTSSGAAGLPITWPASPGTSPSSPNFDVATLAVSGYPAGAVITNISASINMYHTWGSDMQLLLVHPNGSNYVAFVNDPTGSQLIFGNSPTTQPYQYTSTGATMNILANPATANPIPSPGPYKPFDGNGVATTFATFNGLNPNGNWILDVVDPYAGDGAKIELLSLTITATNNVATITHTPVNTNDGNACTTDACNTQTGSITHTQVNTDDGNACTTDACNTQSGSVTHTNVSTDDGNACTTDGCNSSTGVFHTPSNTNDNDVCTTDACNTQTGAITHTNISTDDNNACTADGCDPVTGVFHNTINTDDGNACTTDGCNTSSGVFHNPANTDDGNACTTDACNTFTGTITHDQTSTDDGNACTIDACDSQTGNVTHTPVSFDDNNACTTDACNSQSGEITHTEVNVDDNNACTLDGCDSSTGIYHNGVVTDDGNACTSDGCDSSTGVYHNPVNTDDGDACTDDGCDSLTGVYHNNVETNDGNACTTDGCDTQSGIYHNNVDVDDGNGCTVDACDTQSGNVTHTPVSIDDSNACTEDACDTQSGNVSHTPISIDDGNACTTDACNINSGEITHDPVVTDDNNVCTFDDCDPQSGVISHTPLSTDDGNACTEDGCDPSSGIYHNAINTDDGNACTVDDCDTASGVYHNTVNTDDGDACTSDGCNSITGAFHTNVNSDDGNACTIDGCDTSTGVFHNSVNIDDGNACTTDGCDSATGIFHTNVVTDDGNACTTDACDTNTGNVSHTPVLIDDNNICTTDACNTSSGQVTHTPVDVDDNNPCTNDGCDSSTGVYHSTFDCGVTLYSNIFIEGYYIGTGLMNNCLFIDEISSNPEDADLITISAMSPTSPYGLVDSKTDTLKRNGNVNISFGPSVISNNFYYLKVTHRNAVETWSANPVLLSPATTYLFSDAASKAYGDNEIATHLLGDGPDGFGYAIYSGDIGNGDPPGSGIQDGSIDASDFIDLDPSIQNGDGGYLLGDLNGDGSVDATDFLVLDPNIQNGVGSSIP